MAQRRRQRDHAGQSEYSYKKHRLLWRAASGQGHAWRRTHPKTRGLIIDTHAGNGEGVPMPQLELFGSPPTWPTPFLAMRLAQDIGNTDVILCEADRRARDALAERFPAARLLPDYAQVPGALQGNYRWALVINDPCGHGHHGIDMLEQLTPHMRLDTIVVFNEASYRRHMGVNEQGKLTDNPRVAASRAAREKYLWMAEPKNWASKLGARQMARSMPLKGSPGFHYRIFVLSHTLSQTLRHPTWERIL